MGVVPLKKNSFPPVTAVTAEWDFPFGLAQTADQGWAFGVVFSEQKVLLLEGFSHQGGVMRSVKRPGKADFTVKGSCYNMWKV